MERLYHKRQISYLHVGGSNIIEHGTVSSSFPVDIKNRSHFHHPLSQIINIQRYTNPSRNSMYHEKDQGPLREDFQFITTFVQRGQTCYKTPASVRSVHNRFGTVFIGKNTSCCVCTEGKSLLTRALEEIAKCFTSHTCRFMSFFSLFVFFCTRRITLLLWNVKNLNFQKLNDVYEAQLVQSYCSDTCQVYCLAEILERDFFRSSNVMLNVARDKDSDIGQVFSEEDRQKY